MKNLILTVVVVVVVVVVFGFSNLFSQLKSGINMKFNIPVLKLTTIPFIMSKILKSLLYLHQAEQKLFVVFGMEEPIGKCVFYLMKPEYGIGKQNVPTRIIQGFTIKWENSNAVSYTHLTLPTNREV